MHGSQNISNYCTSEDCYFVENSYKVCGFEDVNCNPVTEGE